MDYKDKIKLLDYWIKNPENIGDELPSNLKHIEKTDITLFIMGIGDMSIQSLVNHKSDLLKFHKNEIEIEFIEAQKQVMKKNQEFINLQKIDLKENKENRQKIQNLTFVLAFGVIITLAYNLYTALWNLFESPSLHGVFISAVFAMIFTGFAIIIISVFDMVHELKNVFKIKLNRYLFIILFTFIASLFIGLFFFSDMSLEEDYTNEFLSIENSILEQNNILNNSFNGESCIYGCMYAINIIDVNESQKFKFKETCLKGCN